MCLQSLIKLLFYVIALVLWSSDHLLQYDIVTYQWYDLTLLALKTSKSPAAQSVWLSKLESGQSFCQLMNNAGPQYNVLFVRSQYTLQQDKSYQHSYRNLYTPTASKLCSKLDVYDKCCKSVLSVAVITANQRDRLCWCEKRTSGPGAMKSFWNLWFMSEKHFRSEV
jgi:hypothetical protein